MPKGKRFDPRQGIPNQQKAENQGLTRPVTMSDISPDAIPTPVIPEDPEGNVPLEQLSYNCCGLCAHRTTIKGLCVSLPPQLVPVAIMPAPVKVLTPGSIPPMLVKSKAMRVLVGERDVACGLYNPLTEEEKAQRLQVREAYEKRMEEMRQQAEANKQTEKGPETPETPPAPTPSTPPFNGKILGPDGQPYPEWPATSPEQPQSDVAPDETPQ